MKKFAIYGGGSFGQEMWLIIKDIIAAGKLDYEFVGFIDDIKAVNTTVKYGTVIGNIDFLNKIDFRLDLVIAINQPKALKTLYNKITNPNISFPNYIHPSVSFYDKESFSMGKGNIIAHLGLISFDVKLGDFNIFNTRASIGHHVQIGSFNTFNPNIQLSGNVNIGDMNVFGLNVGVIPKKKIGNGNTIGAGSILLRSIKDDSLYIGNPAKILKLDNY